jgi:acetoin utilization protein AcuB
MLVKDCMTRHPVMVPATMPAAEAQGVMAENKIRHLIVAGDGKKLEGLVTRERLAFKPDTLASLNVWEITRYLSNVTVKDIMIKADKVHTITPDRTIERASSILSAHKIGCLPVIEDGIVVGILSRVDVLHSLEQMLGLPVEGVRVTIRMPHQKGEFAKLTSAIAKYGLGIMGIGSFPTPRRSDSWDVVLKIPRVSMDEVKGILSQVPGQEIVDIREFA